MDKPTGKKLPKWFWPVGIVAAIVIGLYLRNRSKSQPASSQQQGTATDVTSNPYYYTASGGYSDPYGTGGASPYGAASLAGSYGLPAGFDPTSFEEGITYGQQQLGAIPNPSPTTDSTGSAPVPTVANGGTPANITINVTPTKGTRTSGRPSTSGRRHRHSNNGGYWTDTGHHTGKPPGHNASGGTLGAWTTKKHKKVKAHG